MLARWYSLFLGFLFLVLGIVGLTLVGRLPTPYGGLIATLIIWLAVAVVSLWVGFRVRSSSSVRWYAGVLGGLFFVWGVIQLAASPTAVLVGVIATVASVGGFLVLLGSLGLAAALVPAGWLQEAAPAAT